MEHILIRLLPAIMQDLHGRLDGTGQWIMLVLTIFALLILVIFLRKIWLLLKAAYRDSQFAARFFAHNNLQQACDNLRMKPTPVSRMFVAGLIEWNFWKKHPNAPSSDRWSGVTHAMEFQSDIEVADMKRGLAILSWMALLAPFLALVGALWRLATGFGAISQAAVAPLSPFIVDALLLVILGVAIGLAARTARDIVMVYCARFAFELAKQNERFVSWAYR